MDPTAPKVSIVQISEYIGDKKRRAIEGEAVLDAGHIISCGTIGKEPGKVTVQALCVKSSHLREKPHELHAVVECGIFWVAGSWDQLGTEMEHFDFWSIFALLLVLYFRIVPSCFNKY